MAKHLILLGRLLSNGSHRQEVGTFLAEASELAKEHPQVDDIINMPVQMCPTPVARNTLVAEAQKRGADVLVMVDDDMGVPAGFLRAAFDFLLQHNGPAVIAAPYCQAPPREEVNVFEWGSAESHCPASAALVNICREDAARRQGIERVASIGTGCILYSMRCFDKLAHPYYDYLYADQTHTQVVETEDCYLHRALWVQGIPIYCHWDYWCWHWKIKRVGKPEAVSPDVALKLLHIQNHANKKHAEREAGKNPPASLPLTANHAVANGKPHVLCSIPSARPAIRPASSLDVESLPGIGEPWTLEHAENFREASAATGPRPMGLTARAEPFPLWRTKIYGADSTPGACDYALSVNGWMHPAELEWLAEQASRMQPGDTWVEVGTWRGRSWSAVVLAAAEGTTVWAIDPWDQAPPELERYCRESGMGPTEALKDFQQTCGTVANLRVVRNEDGTERGVKANVMRAPSVEAASSGRFSDGSLAVVFIDGAHDRASVEADLKAWLPKVRLGGLICGHDRNDEGVDAALMAVFGDGDGAKWQYSDGPGSIWFVRLAAAPTEPVQSR